MLILKIFLGFIYVVLIIFTIIRILLDTHSTPKTLAYLMLVLMFPAVGVIIYFSVGINYRHSGSRNRGILAKQELDEALEKNIPDATSSLLKNHERMVQNFASLAGFIRNLAGEHLSENTFTLLINGEEKYPEVILALESAKNFIHMEYYAWENDIRGNQIKEVLLRKAKDGIKVRVIYDAYASRKIKRNIVRELKNGGVSIFPQIKLKPWMLFNRINHRDHRKIVIVDGTVGFVGGINVSDRYDNSIDTGLYWRDTHVRFAGPLVGSLQRHFIVSWNSCQDEKLTFRNELFPDPSFSEPCSTEGLGQIVAGGPIYPMSNIMLTYSRIFTLAKERLYITNPYFVPSDSILDSLKQAAIGGADVRLMIPFKSDSWIVGATSRFYIPELVKSGIRVFLYKKGFVHAKTVVADTSLSVVGTANMDIRSFDLNFEIMSVIYGHKFAAQLEQAFLNDLQECHEILSEELKKTGITTKLTYAIARLISSFL